MEPTSTSLGTGDILGSVGVGRRAKPRRKAIRSPRPRRGYRGEVRRARLLKPHSYARWPWEINPSSFLPSHLRDCGKPRKAGWRNIAECSAAPLIVEEGSEFRRIE